MRQGEWSGWLRAEFPLIPGLASATGMFRVYAKQLHPRFELYISPVNIDPEAPELPISAPASYSREIARATGPFYTQGIAEDTAAMRQGVFSLAEYLAQSRLVFEDEHKLLRYALSQLSSRAALRLFLQHRSEFAHALGRSTSRSCSRLTAQWTQPSAK